MTPLRQRMLHDLQLRGYSDRTVECYVRAVAQLAQFRHASPDQLSEEQVRQYLLHLSTVQKVARGTHTIALCGIKFFYTENFLSRLCLCGERCLAFIQHRVHREYRDFTENTETNT